MEAKLLPTSRYHRSVARTVAILVALAGFVSAASLYADDKDKEKDKSSDTSVQSRDRDYTDAVEHEDANVKTDAQKFIKHVAHANFGEIRLGNLAKERAQSQQVKDFADRLVRDHTQANAELKTIAQKMNVPWDFDTAAGTVSSTTSATATTTPSTARGGADTLNAPESSPGTTRAARPKTSADVKAHEQKAYDHLASLSGKAFDDAFMHHMVLDHKREVAKFEKASRDLPAGDLKAFVDKTLPTLKEHLTMAQQLAPKADRTRQNVRDRTTEKQPYKSDRENK